MLPPLYAYATSKDSLQQPIGSLLGEDTYQSLMAAMPGRVLPSRYSSMAPPPVDT